jgi:predicted kinase
MTRLLITRGLPGSGKTTYAKAWVAEDVEHRARVNRDDVRAMLNDSAFVKGVTETRAIAARDAAISSLLRLGVDVICDDTNLQQRTARDLAKIAARAGAEVTVVDLTDVPLETCLLRNSRRADKPPVPEDAIRSMHSRFLTHAGFPLPLPEEPADTATVAELYEPKPAALPAVLVDIDGTMALKGARSPFDETRVHEDRPNLPVIEVVRQECAAGKRVIFMSGRTDACREATEEWLRVHFGVPWEALHMRPAGDMRKDSVVKRELFDRHVRDHYDVRRVYDDRDQVVKAWREIGLTCLQVAPGEF